MKRARLAEGLWSADVMIGAIRAAHPSAGSVANDWDFSGVVRSEIAVESVVANCHGDRLPFSRHTLACLRDHVEGSALVRAVHHCAATLLTFSIVDKVLLDRYVSI